MTFPFPFFSPLAEIVVTGGSLAYDGAYSVRTFNASGTLGVSGGDLTADILLIASGGSGGGGYFAGGGAAGGMLEQAGRSIPAGSYPITIGAGAAAATGNGVNGNPGNDSTFDTCTALGGGFGAGYSAGGTNGDAGGSGGGAAANAGGTGGAATQGASGGATGYGFMGGDSSNNAGGGGGGAGGEGTDATVGAQTAAGVGRSNSITGAAVTYAKGGRGGYSSGTSTNGTDNKGEGGDGGTTSGGTSGEGGDGVFILRYPTAGDSMSYYAEVSGTTVVRVIVIDDAIDAEKWLASNLGGSWVECRKSGFKKQFPAVGYSYDSTKEEFVTKKPFPSWNLDSKNEWKPPKVEPADKTKDSWNEITQEWEAKK